MNQTQNLGLPVYGANDKPSWMDTNNGFEKLDNIVGGAAGVQLDFANPLHVFTQSNNTYTATQTCWLFGSIIAADNAYGYVTVDGTRIAGTYDANIGYPAAFIPPIRIEAGSVIAVANLGPDTYPARQCLAVYPGEIVSDTFVWNEAIVELNYANPLHSFTANNLTYTATKRCWLVGALSNTRTVTINGTYISEGMNGATTEINIPLSKGDVVVSNQENLYLHVFDGEIKGSAPGFAGSGEVLELLDIANAVVLTTTNYTTPKVGCIVGGIYKNADNLKIILDDDTTHPLTYADGSNRTCVFIPGIPKGSRLKLSTSNSSAVSFVPYKYESIAPEITVYNEAEVELDYANPLHTFTTGNLTYTATGDCWLVGAIYGSNSDNRLTINGIEYFRGYHDSGSMITDAVIQPLKLKKDDVVSVRIESPLLHILKGTVVGSVGNIGGGNAIPLLDYGNPVHTFTDGHLTYTVPNGSPDLYLCGTLLYNTEQDISLTINGTQIMRIAANSLTASYPITAGAPLGMMRVTAGDVITVSYRQPNLSLFEER